MLIRFCLSLFGLGLLHREFIFIYLELNATRRQCHTNATTESVNRANENETQEIPLRSHRSHPR